jgi:hypothetical protein
MEKTIQELHNKIKMLEKENLELKNKLNPFLEEQNKRKEYLERRDRIDEKISQMLYNFHNQNK